MSVQIKGLSVKGLNPNDDHDLSEHDTPPNAINVWFDVDDVFFPVIVNEKGEVTREEHYEKRVFFNFEYDMGFCAGRQRVRDTLRFDESTGKWEIVRFAPKGQSQIREYPEQWNAFYEGLNYNEIGTPLEILFARDKSFIKHLNKCGIFTAERLAAITEGEAQLGGMGVLDAKRKAMAYFERMNQGKASREVEAHIEALEQYKAQADRQIAELKDMVTTLMAERESEAPAKTTRKYTRRAKIENEEGVSE